MKSQPFIPVIARILLAFLLVPAAYCQVVQLPKARILSTDFTNMTFMVMVQDTNLTVFITSETRFFRNGKYAISKDLTAGETARGALRHTADGRHEAVRIFMQSDEPAKPPTSPTPAPTR